MLPQFCSSVTLYDFLSDSFCIQIFRELGLLIDHYLSYKN
jgi:hypothetical protein